ncbi:hypothetical protein SEA_WATERT_46 [Microbacterium phage WaterT]|nr:hypothetical protein SEA_WATERT_46 [Microbacterium phage WaterT]QDK01445.1 hypothetical protein SEA_LEEROYJENKINS_48 [Microbacterium phage LeeroyJenkins]QOC59369.1 hypothetical protein SEA_LIFES_43 [Microbacterium phage Lifes]USH44502.1 hypothetical protein SEA_CASSITA_47 [Microbacterium phage Cassita]
MADDVFPRRNLPDLAENWGRDVEKRIVATDAEVASLKQFTQAQNRSNASSLEVLAGQIQAVEEAQEEIRVAQAAIVAAQADITSTQNSIIATQNFLSTQTVYSAKGTEDTWSGTPGGTVWLPFSSTYDCSVSVTTGSAGRLLIQASANLMAGGGINTLMGIEVVGQVGPSVPSPFTSYVTDSVAGVTRVAVFAGSANTNYTVRIRRGVQGGGAGGAVWAVQTLAVTRS